MEKIEKKNKWSPRQADSAGSSRPSTRSSVSSKGTVGSSQSLSGDTNIKVVVRVRPLSKTERERSDKSIVNLESERCIRLSNKGPGGVKVEKSFSFNRCFGQETSQSEFFEECGVKRLLDSSLDGYNSCVFAYGQTGSGKTFTMSGYEEQIAAEAYRGGSSSDGLIIRSIQYIFDKVNQASNTEYCIKASYCEIYNEQVFDLLNLSENSLPVRWSSRLGFFVEDLCVVICNSVDDVLEVVSEGHRNRRVGSHAMNKDSSRSHSILTLHLEAVTIDEEGHQVKRQGVTRFVDLAGSERLKQTNSEGVTLTETTAINKSLFVLSKCISALAGSQGQLNTGTHIPFRDSKLTKLLNDCLGGNSLALMTCCISPAASYLEETLNTLKYGSRASRIKNTPTLNMDPKEKLIARLKEEIRLLKAENAYLRQHAGEFPAEANEEPKVSLPPILDAIGGGKDNNLVPPGMTSFSPNAPSTGKSGPTSPKSMALKQQEAHFQQQGPNIESILAGYAKEVEILRRENGTMRYREATAERNYRAAMLENESLQKKLENLEEVFVHTDNGQRDTAIVEGLRQENQHLRSQLDRLTQRSHFQRRPSVEFGEENQLNQALQQSKAENVHLLNIIQEFKQREASLMNQLNAYGCGEGGGNFSPGYRNNYAGSPLSVSTVRHQPFSPEVDVDPPGLATGFGSKLGAVSSPKPAKRFGSPNAMHLEESKEDFGDSSEEQKFLFD